MKTIEDVLITRPHDSRWIKRYVTFIRSRQQRVLCQNTPIDKHHICPKAKDLFPEYGNLRQHPWNSIYLTHREHFIAHWMLWKAYGGSQTYAFSSMSNQMCYNSRIHAVVKADTIKLLKERRHSEETKTRMRKPKPAGFGNKISASLTGRRHSATHNESQRIAQTGLAKHSAAYKKALSERMTGPGNHMFGTKHSMESKSKMKEKAQGRGIGLRWYNDGNTTFRCYPNKALPEWKKGRKI